MSKKEIIVGIDLGTTNSVVSILESGLPKTIAIDGQPLLFSVVSLVDGSFVVGREARNMALLEPENTISSIKRKMGQDVKVQIGDKMMRPEEISALILKRIWKEVKAYKNLSDNAGIRSVITVPAYFTEEQRKATKEAAELAGFTVERIINEPTAAALAFGMSKLEEATYAIYDFGGGTFDVSVIESNEGLVEVLASGGNNRLGGDDLDEILANYIWTEFKTKNKLKDVELTAKEKNRLIRIAETTKVKLSTQHEVLIKESFFYKRGENHLHLELLLTNTKFEELIQSKIEETVKHLQHTIEDANVGRGDLTGILLVGGSSRIPLVSRMIEKALNLSPELIPNPDEAVSHGATVQGAIIDGIDLNTVLVDITPYSLGTSTISDELKFFSAKLQKMEADEEFEEREHLIMSVIIPKNTPIPTKKTKTYYSVAPFQKEYELDVLQGEQKISIGNRQIGKTTLEIKKPVEDGEVEVTFELDINGILHMQATEIKTKESVTAQFKSAKGKTVSKAELLDNDVIIAEESLLISRGGKLLKSDAIPEEDKEELSGLLENLKSQKTENDHAAMEDTEQQILDLLFYLESGNEDEG